jgi:hypothetical protein
MSATGFLFRRPRAKKAQLALERPAYPKPRNRYDMCVPGLGRGQIPGHPVKRTTGRQNGMSQKQAAEALGLKRRVVQPPISVSPVIPLAAGH